MKERKNANGGPSSTSIQLYPQNIQKSNNFLRSLSLIRFLCLRNFRYLSYVNRFAQCIDNSADLEKRDKKGAWFFAVMAWAYCRLLTFCVPMGLREENPIPGRRVASLLSLFNSYLDQSNGSLIPA